MLALLISRAVRVGQTLAMAGLTPTAESDERRSAGLATMQHIATGLLLGVTVVFIVARVIESHLGDGSWASYVRATAEAGMVGAIADWFAVTALFRHPLGLRIPHTAIIPERKNEIGRGLGEFVQTNFASGALLADRVAGFEPSRRAADWLSDDANALLLGRGAVAAIRWSMDRLRDDEVAAALEHLVVGRARQLDVGPILGRALAAVTAEGRHEDLVDEALRTLVRTLDATRADLWTRFVTTAPWWVPERLDERIFDRLFIAGRNMVAEAANDRGHVLRVRLDARIDSFAEELQHDPALEQRAAEWRDRLIDDPTVRTWVSGLWGDGKRALTGQLDNPSSAFRQRLDSIVGSAATQLRQDVALRTKIDEWVVRQVRTLADEHGHEIARLVATTVERWDGDDTARRIELQVGRDLQFIRINGTVVGGLAGLLIYTVSRFV